MNKSVSAICLGMLVISGCASGQAASAPTPAPTLVVSGPSAAVAEAARRLGSALLPAPGGMKVAYGPETGAFGELRATRMGLEAMRQADLDRPACAAAGQLDVEASEVKRAPAAVVAFSSAEGSVTEALVSLPDRSLFPGELPKKCASYQATVRGTKITYRTRKLNLPKQGDESRAFLTTVSGGGDSAQIGTMAVRHGNVVLSLLIVGKKVKGDGMKRVGELAFQRLVKVMK